MSNEGTYMKVYNVSARHWHKLLQGTELSCLSFNGMNTYHRLTGFALQREGFSVKEYAVYF